MNFKYKENDIIEINDSLRLRVPFKTEWDKAIEWYSNRKVLYFSEGIPLDSSEIYEMDTVDRMYTYLNKIRYSFFYRDLREF